MHWLPVASRHCMFSSEVLAVLRKANSMKADSRGATSQRTFLLPRLAGRPGPGRPLRKRSALPMFRSRNSRRRTSSQKARGALGSCIMPSGCLRR
jgi:hypothetical protein